MRTLIISDVHGNSVALKAVLMKESFDELVVLGDIVGYGPSPGKCCDLVRLFSPLCVRGNHEEALLNPLLLDRFNSLAKEALLFTKNNLKNYHIDFLSTLPYIQRREDVVYTHSSPVNPNLFNYLFPEDSFSKQVQETFNYMKDNDISICFCGHTHYPGFFYKNETTTGFIPWNKNYSFILREDTQYIINVGSVGQPRNNNPDAQYVLFDRKNKKIDFLTTKYDIDLLKDDFEKANLPKELLLRLYNGI